MKQAAEYFVRVAMNTELNKLPGTEELQSVDAKLAAKLLDIGLRTVRRLIASGKLASYRVGRCVRIRLADLRAYQEQNMLRGCV